jgi:hypothetical protein
VPWGGGVIIAKPTFCVESSGRGYDRFQIAIKRYKEFSILHIASKVVDSFLKKFQENKGML